MRVREAAPQFGRARRRDARTGMSGASAGDEGAAAGDAPPRAYVAGMLADRAQVRRAQRALVERGFAIARDWTAAALAADEHGRARCLHAPRDGDGAARADLVLALMPDPAYAYPAVLAEVRRALALGKQVVALCPEHARARAQPELADGRVRPFPALGAFLHALDAD